jgi:hypothetical protein
VTKDELNELLAAEISKSLIALPAEGLKAMATGCPTVAAVYAGIIGLLYHDAAVRVPLGTMLNLVAPFLLFIGAAVCFGWGYLPKWKLIECLQKEPLSQTDVVDRQHTMKRSLWVGLAIFWVAIAWSVTNVVVRPGVQVGKLAHDCSQCATQGRGP